MATYIIRAGTNGPVKIGRADDAEQRCRALQTGHPETLQIIRVVQTAFDAEPIFHEAFSAQRIRGEWFTFVDEMLTFDPATYVRSSPPQEAPTTAVGAIMAAVRREYGIDRAASRRISVDIGVSFATADRWLSGKGEPHGYHIVKLMAASPEVLRTVDRITDREGILARAQDRLRRAASIALAGFDPGPASAARNDGGDR